MHAPARPASDERASDAWMRRRAHSSRSPYFAVQNRARGFRCMAREPCACEMTARAGRQSRRRGDGAGVVGDHFRD